MTEAAVVDDADNVEDTDETDDATAEPAATVAKPAERIPGADFEPGPDSPLNDDGSPKWNSVEAYGRHWDATINEERAKLAKRMW